jgi:hypothetical protein
MWDVTDTSALGGSLRRAAESWQVVLSAGLAVLLAASLTAALKDLDPASADTFVTAATRAQITLPNGEQKEATTGAKLPRGATLRTGDAGGARLSTAGRDVYVGALSTLKVLDGVRQQLDRGLLMVDTRSGPRLTLATTAGAGTVAAPEGALARVEQNVATLRLAVYSGTASITAAGRSATAPVPALRQVRIPYGGVPEAITALSLTVKNGVYDTWEQRLASSLVQADIDLNAFATGLNGTDGQAVLQAAPVAMRSMTLLGRTTGEQALSVAVAQKARLRQSVSENLAEVEQHRGDGGSWGVVAAIVRAPVTEVTQVLGASLDDPVTTPPLLAGGPRSGGSVDGSGGGSRPTSSPTPAPLPTRTPVIVDPPPPPPPPRTVIDEAVDAVASALPTPVPTPTPTPGLLRQVLELPGRLLP